MSVPYDVYPVFPNKISDADYYLMSIKPTSVKCETVSQAETVFINAVGERVYLWPGLWTTAVLSGKLPPPITLVSPTTGSTVTGSYVVCRWVLLTYLGDPNTKYRFEYARNSTFTLDKVVFDYFNVYVAPTKTLFGLTKNYTYYWRVRAKNKYGIGPWSPIWSFIKG